MEAAISADIVSSTSLSSEDLSNIRDELRDTMNTIIKCFWRSDAFYFSQMSWYKFFWGRIIKGDSIECYLNSVTDSLRFTLLLKLRTKVCVASLDCSKETKKYGLRFAIGAGTFKMVDRERDIIDGPPIYLSGREMQKGKKPDHRRLFLTEEDPYGAIKIINDLVVWLDDRVNNMTAKQCEAVYYMLLEYKRSDILELLHFEQNTLSQRLISSDWNRIESTIIDFEMLNFDRLCYM